jgi:hypothetical protein
MQVALVSASPVTLSPESVRAVAEAVAELLAADAPAAVRQDQAPAPQLVSAAELAERLRVDVKSVYRHADELQAIRVGRRVMFDPQRALAAWPDALGSRYRSMGSQTPETRMAAGRTDARGRVPSDGHCQLLPVGRRQAADRPAAGDEASKHG